MYRVVQQLDSLLKEVKNCVNNYIHNDNVNIDIKIITEEVITPFQNTIHQFAIFAFVATIDSNKEVIGEERCQCLLPLIEKWENRYLKETINQEQFLAFHADLNNFSEKNTNWQINDLNASAFFQKCVWEELFDFYDVEIKKIIENLGLAITKKNNKFYNLLETRFVTLDPYEFEIFISDVFKKMGYETIVTSKSGDFGIDIIAENEREKVAIQVKKYSSANKVSNIDVQKLIGGMNYKSYKADRAILITTSDFTEKAREQAKNNPVELWNYEKLRMIITNLFLES